MPWAVILLLVAGLVGGSVVAPNMVKDATNLIHETASIPGTAAQSLQTARAVELANNLAAAKVDLDKELLAAPEMRGLATTLMGAGYAQQIRDKELALKTAQANFDLFKAKNATDTKIVEADMNNRVNKALWETRISIALTIAGGVSGTILAFLGTLWLAYIVLRFLDGWTQAQVHKANDYTSQRTLYGGYIWDLLRLASYFDKSGSFLPKVPPELTLVANTQTGTVIMYGVGSDGVAIYERKGPDLIEALRQRTMIQLADLAMKTMAQVAKSDAQARLTASKSGWLDSLARLIGREVPAQQNGMMAVPSSTMNPQFAEVMRAAAQSVKIISGDDD